MSEEILEKFYKVLKNETEENIRNFIIENFDSFPEDLKIDFLGTFFEEGLDLAVTAMEERNKYLEEVLSAHKNLNYFKRLLEDKLRELQIKEK
ncbi:MAG: hypothetical protein NZ822_03075 [Patescibacteria group bacterium]|nr:hypothetical protein [Patescibacteria group bacterium]